jgi:hypothetical protein
MVTLSGDDRGAAKSGGSGRGEPTDCSVQR